MPRGRPPHNETQREEAERKKRSRLQTAGWQIFVENGYYLATTDMIVERCGLSKKTFYDFYPAKGDLLIDLARGPSALIEERDFELDAALPLAEMLLSAFNLSGLDFDRHLFGLAAWEGRKFHPELVTAFETAEKTLSRYLGLFLTSETELPAVSRIIMQVVYGCPLAVGSSAAERLNAIMLDRCRLIDFVTVLCPHQRHR